MEKVEIHGQGNSSSKPVKNMQKALEMRDEEIIIKSILRRKLEKVQTGKESMVELKEINRENFRNVLAGFAELRSRNPQNLDFIPKCDRVLDVIMNDRETDEVLRINKSVLGTPQVDKINWNDVYFEFKHRIVIADKKIKAFVESTKPGGKAAGGQAHLSAMKGQLDKKIDAVG